MYWAYQNKGYKLSHSVADIFRPSKLRSVDFQLPGLDIFYLNACDVGPLVNQNSDKLG